MGEKYRASEIRWVASGPLLISAPNRSNCGAPSSPTSIRAEFDRAIQPPFDCGYLGNLNGTVIQRFLKPGQAIGHRVEELPISVQFLSLRQAQSHSCLKTANRNNPERPIGETHASQRVELLRSVWIVQGVYGNVVQTAPTGGVVRCSKASKRISIGSPWTSSATESIGSLSSATKCWSCGTISIRISWSPTKVPRVWILSIDYDLIRGHHYLLAIVGSPEFSGSRSPKLLRRTSIGKSRSRSTCLARASPASEKRKVAATARTTQAARWYQQEI